MARTHTFKGSLKGGYGHYAFIEDGELVLGESWPREGGETYRGSYADATGALANLEREAPALASQIRTYYETHAPESAKYKFKVGEEVDVKMAFAMPTALLIDAPGFKARITKRDFKNGIAQYQLKNFTGWWPETTLFKLEDS